MIQTDSFEDIIELTETRTDFGPVNSQWMNLDRLRHGSELYGQFVQMIGKWLAAENIEVITAVPEDGNRFARDAAALRNIPYLEYHLRDGAYELSRRSRRARSLMEHHARVGIVQGVRGTGAAAVEVAQQIPNVGAAYAIIDRGHDAVGIRTAELARNHTQRSGFSPPVHAPSRFPWQVAMRFPLSSFGRIEA